jgi:hypothetical protein
VLPEGRGVTYRFFGAGRTNANDEDREADADDQGANNSNSDFLYIPDVVTNADVHFFEIPRLGSYLAVPIIVKSYLNELSFDDAIVKIKAYKEQVAERDNFQREKENEYADKIEMARGSDEDEFKRLTQELEELEFEKVPEPEFEFETLNYIMCCDTIGKDVEISGEHRKLIVEICQHFRDSWEESELNYLRTDAERFIEAEKGADNEDRGFGFTEAEEREVQQNNAEINELSEIEGFYRADEYRLSAVKEQLQSSSVMKSLLGLQEYRFIKHARVIQNVLYLVGYKKKEINLEGTNLLDWPLVRTKYFNEEMVKKLTDYDYAGEKREGVPVYARIQALKERLSKICKT